MTLPNRLLACLCIASTAFLFSCNESEDFNSDMVRVQALLGLADVYRKQGQYRASVIEIQNALAVMPDNLDTQIFIAELYLEIGDVNQAIQYLEAAQRATPNNARLTLLLAEAYLAANRASQGEQLLVDLQVSGENEVQKAWLQASFHAARSNIQAAREGFEAILAGNPDHVPTLIALSKISYLEQDIPRASELAQRAAGAGGPDNVDVWIWRGQLAMLQEDWPAAESAYFEALDIMSLYDVMTTKRFSTLQSVLIPLQMQGKNQAALQYSEIIASSPQGEFNTTYTNVLALFQQGALEEAQSELQGLLASAPNHPGSNILMGLARYSAGDFQEAERLLGQYVNPDSASPQLVTALAATHLRMNQPARALTVVQNALTRNPGNLELMNLTGAIQRGLGQLDASVAILEEAVGLDPESPALRVSLAGSYAAQQEHDRAISELETALRLAPDHALAKSTLLEIHLNRRANGIPDAERLAQEWLREAPDDYSNNMAAAMVAMRAEKADDAQRYLTRASELDTSNHQPQLLLARLDAVAQRYDAAADRFNAVLQQSPGNSDALTGILAIADIRNTPETGIERVQQISAANPSEFMPPVILSQFFLVKNNNERALEYAEQAYGIARNNVTTSILVEAGNRQAVQAMQQQDFASARNLTTRSLGLQPDNVQTLSLLASLAAQAENYGEAETYVARIRELQPDAAYSFELEGDLYRASRDLDSAISAYRTAWERQPTPALGLKLYQSLQASGERGEAMSFLEDWRAENDEEIAPTLLLAMDLQSDGEDQGARDLYEEVLTRAPDNMIMLNNLAWLLQDTAPPRALELAGRAAVLYPENADVLDTYGWILYRQDQRDEALAVLEKALALAPENAAIREHLETVRQR